MKPLFNVTVVQFRIVEVLPGAWPAADLVKLLDVLEFSDAQGLSEDELLEMSLMSLQDIAPEAAASVLLRFKLADRLSKGQIDNMSNEMLDEKLWEEYADIALHEELFNIGSLLYASRPSLFPKPDAVVMSLNIAAANAAAEEILREMIQEPFLVRLLSDGVDAQATLHRLFDKPLAGGPFPEAESIVWTVETQRLEDGSTMVDLISSGYWFDSLRETKAFESQAEPL